MLTLILCCRLLLGVITLGKFEIRLADAPVLRQVARPVPKMTKRVAKLLREMEETMYAAQGIGLAAPQIGVSQRLVVIDVGDGPLHLINPQVQEREGSEVDMEGCLSVPDVWGYVDRSEAVIVDALDLRGKPTRIEAHGLLARALQHEIDHLDGILFIDKMLPNPTEEPT
jgi:peptide deformylase